MTFYCADVKKFHDKFGLITPPVFYFIPFDLFDFRLRFFHEELQELQDAYAVNNLGEVIDALIDMVYITCGCALLHGIDVPDFAAMVENHNGEDVISLGESEHQAPHPHLMSPKDHQALVAKLKKGIERYQDAYAASDVVELRNALAALYINSLYASAEMNFTNDQWNELWSDVQRANMSKVRALKATDSKRGSTHDVVKPAGWIPPRTEALVAKFVRGEN